MAGETAEMLPRLTKQRVVGVGWLLPSFPDALLHSEFEKVMAARPPAGPRGVNHAILPDLSCLLKSSVLFNITVFTHIFYFIFIIELLF